MDSMSDGPEQHHDAPPVRSGAMRVVMLNARTAVLVPEDAPDPVPVPDAEDHDADTSWAGDHDAAATDERGDLSALAETVFADEGPEAGADAADDAVTGPWHDAADGVDADPFAADIDTGPAEDTGTGAGAPAETAPTAPASTATDGPDGRWKAELLSRLDDLGRILASVRTVAPTADDGAQDAAATVTRLEQRFDAGLAALEVRVAGLERAQQDAAPPQDGPSVTDLSEMVADLRMQMRMIEVQVGTLGKLLAAGPPADGVSAEALRTRLAEVMAREQRLASAP